MITVTEQAAAKIKENLTRRGSGLGIRLGVKTTGCSGLAYVLEYVDTPKSEDMSFVDKSVHIFTDLKSLAYLHGVEIDYVRKGLNEGFEFTNPNVKDECGCGESFRV
jgi:iron-sulfur cluster assembly protein